jgi:hypothetical protein
MPERVLIMPVNYGDFWVLRSNTSPSLGDGNLVVAGDVIVKEDLMVCDRRILLEIDQLREQVEKLQSQLDSMNRPLLERVRKFVTSESSANTVSE